jgi:hypothetical protein
MSGCEQINRIGGGEGGRRGELHKLTLLERVVGG